MKTIEERARQWASIERPYGGQTELIRGYIAGATDQKQIDEDAFHAIMEENVIKAIEKQRQIDIDKACQWWLDYLAYPTDSDEDRARNKAMIDEFRKAMEK